MARPKKFTTETVVISFRIPKDMEAKVRDVVGKLISFGTVKVQNLNPHKDEIRTINTHAEGILNGLKEAMEIQEGKKEAISMDEWLEKEFKEDIEKYEKEIEVLQKTGSNSVLTKKRLEFCQNKVRELKRKLNNH